MKEQAQLAYEFYASYLDNDLGHPLEGWDKLPESIRGAWRFAVKKLLNMKKEKNLMPCGGIYPIEASTASAYPCWACNKRGADHFVEEWDAFIHKDCIREFLKNEEGQVVVQHKHLIQIGEEVLQEEGQLNVALVVTKLPDGPGRCWRYSNSDYTWLVAKNLDELKALPWLVELTTRWYDPKRIYRLSVTSDATMRAPWDRNGTALRMLMLEFDGGAEWHPIAGLENPELYGLPEWDVTVAYQKKRAVMAAQQGPGSQPARLVNPNEDEPDEHT